MPDETTTYLSHQGIPPHQGVQDEETYLGYQTGPYREPDPSPYQPPARAAKRPPVVLVGVIGLVLGAALGAGGVLVMHGSGSTARSGQMGNLNGGRGGVPNGVAPSGGFGNGFPGGAPGGAAPSAAASTK